MSFKVWIGTTVNPEYSELAEIALTTEREIRTFYDENRQNKNLWGLNHLYRRYLKKFYGLKKISIPAWDRLDAKIGHDRIKLSKRGIASKPETQNWNVNKMAGVNT